MNKIKIIGINNIIFVPAVFVNWWFWRIFKNDLLASVLIVIGTYLLLIIVTSHKINRFLLAISIAIFIILSILSLNKGYDKLLSKINFAEEIQLNQRHGYFSKELGIFFLNKYSLNFYRNYNPYLYKYERNFFENLDPNLYFFASHPRERAGINEFKKFPSLYFILFIMGIIYSLKLRPLFLLLYLLVAALTCGFISPVFELGPVLFFPFVATLITAGVMYSIGLLRSLIRKKYI